jgi:hypothetical protein
MPEPLSVTVNWFDEEAHFMETLPGVMLVSPERACPTLKKLMASSEFWTSSLRTTAASL